MKASKNHKTRWHPATNFVVLPGLHGLRVSRRRTPTRLAPPHTTALAPSSTTETLGFACGSPQPIALQPSEVVIPAKAGIQAARPHSVDNHGLAHFLFKTTRKVVILRGAKRSRRIHAAHHHPLQHGFRDFARNDFCCLEMETEGRRAVIPAKAGIQAAHHIPVIATAYSISCSRRREKSSFCVERSVVAESMRRIIIHRCMDSATSRGMTAF